MKCIISFTYYIIPDTPLLICFCGGGRFEGGKRLLKVWKTIMELCEKKLIVVVVAVVLVVIV